MVGEGDSALAAFRGYLDRGSSQSLGVAAHALAVFLDGIEARPHYQGAASDDP